MKVFLVDNNKITKFKLPNKVDDSFLFSYNTASIKKCLITFVGINDKWYIKSNGTVDIYDAGAIIDQVEIEDYKKYTLKIVGKPDLIELYFLPINETLFRMSFNGLDSFSVGSSQTCHIYYESPYLTSVQAIFKYMNDEWVMSCVNDDCFKVYVNDVRVTLKKMKYGDVIFIGGLKIIWMKEFICVNNPENNLKITGMALMNDEQDVNQEVSPVSEEEKSVDLYDDEAYFVHFPLIRDNVEAHTVLIDAPPGGEKKDKLPWILTIGTSLTMVASSFMMMFNVWYAFQNNNVTLRVIPQIVMCVAMLVGGLIMPRVSKAYQNKQAKKKEALRQEKYSEYLGMKSREIEIQIQNEVRILNETYLTTDDCLMALNKRTRNFWWCQNDHREFLTLRLGVGRLPASVNIVAPDEHFSLETDDLLKQVYKIKEHYKFIETAPITLSLKDYDVTSLIGESANKDAYVNELLVQLLAMHSPMDLKIVVMTNEANATRWDFAKYIPHAFSDDKSVRFFSTNEEEAKIVSNYLEELNKERREKLGSTGLDNPDKFRVLAPHFLIITDDYKNNKNVPVVDAIVNKRLSGFGYSMLVIEDTIKKVPVTSNAFIEMGDNEGVVIKKGEERNTQKMFHINYATSDLDMHAIAVKLADVPVVLKDGPSVLPTSLSFLDMYGVSRIEQLNVLNRWQTNNPVVSLDTTVGVHANGEKFKLDLHEKFHGPHGLIAGSTGSGKSEFIITYILSLIINYHPYEVQFVLIDYKGGGLAGAFDNKETGVKIPHLIGSITNLDASSMNRSLVSIQSELKRRQRIFNEVRDALSEGTVDIYKYQRLYREGVVKKPLAHLFIICDEFAELKQQRPEFMQQLISASRIGRSLGIHLILATQKPSGVVNDQIWANSKFKVCLKVQDRSDSMEMLKRPEAASIKEAGRFYLQVGYNDYFDIGQSGWAGAKYVPSDRILLKVDESINYINNVGYAVKTIKDVGVEDANKVEHGEQLTNIVKYIYNLGKKEEITTESLWLDPIPEEIFYNDLRSKYGFNPTPYHINPLVGEYDDPVRQRQDVLNIDLSKEGNLAVFGAPGSGKENFLTNLIRAIVTEHTPEEVNIYILDCGSESLKIFNKIPHVGDIVTVSESDKVMDFFKLADEEIERRKDLFSDYAGSYNDYIESSGKKLPLMLFIVNNYDVFAENYSRLNEAIQSLYRDGYKYGVVFVLTAIATNTIRTKTLQHFNNKICLRLSNDADYRNVIPAPRGLVPANYLARGLVEINNAVFEFQTATFAQKKEYNNSLRELTKVLNDAYTTRAPKIPTVPEIVEADEMMQYIQSETVIPVGYNVVSKRVTYWDFGTQGIVPILAADIDNAKMDFIFGLIKLLSSQMTTSVNVIDFVNAYYQEIIGIAAVKENYDEYFVSMYNDIVSKNLNGEIYYFIFGVSTMMRVVSPATRDLLIKLFSSIADYPNIHIIFVDVYNGIKQVMIDEWYQKVVGNQNGIWLGDNIGSQLAFNLKNITMEEKKLNFKSLAFVINKGKHQVVKTVVDWRPDDEE